MNNKLLYNEHDVISDICFMDEYIRAFHAARDRFVRYWCKVRGWDISNLTDDQANEIKNHHDWRKPSVLILPYGHLTQGDEKILRQYSKGIDNAVELGTLFGRGAAILSENASQVYTYDNYSDTNYGGMYHTVSTVKDRLKSYTNIFISKLSTIEAAYDWKYYCNKVDLLFVDADHSYEGVKGDFEAWFKHVNIGGYILFHDYNNIKTHPGVHNFVNELIGENKKIQYIECEKEEEGSIIVFRKVSD